MFEAIPVVIKTEAQARRLTLTGEKKCDIDRPGEPLLLFRGIGSKCEHWIGFDRKTSKYIVE